MEHRDIRDGPARAILESLTVGDRSPFELMRDARRREGGRDILGPGTLFRVILRLRRAGLIRRKVGGARPGDEHRMELTGAGQRALAAALGSGPPFTAVGKAS